MAQRRVAIVVLLAAVSLAGCTRIGPGYVGIKMSNAGSNRGVDQIPTSSGWVFYNPMFSTVYEYPTFVQTAVWSLNAAEGNPANEELTFSNADQQKVSVDISISYSLVPDKVPAFYVKFRNDDLNVFTHGYLRNQARNIFDRVGGKYHNEQILGDNAAFLLEVETELKKSVAPLGVQIEQFGLIGVPRLPDGVIASINAKISAQQVAIQKQNEVAQAEADARKAVATSEGEARSEIARAEGYAKSIEIKSTADAIANRRLSESLTSLLVEAQKVQKWNGAVPQVSGGAVPMINLAGK